MTTRNDHVDYHDRGSPMNPALVRQRAHVVEVIDADTLTLDVDRPGLTTERIESVPRCDPAQPEAGHWSEIPA